MKRPPVRVLVIDDSPEVLFAVGQALKREPYEVDPCPSGRQGLSMLLQHRYAAVVCDVYMPGMSGIELLRIVRDDPDLRTVPVVLMTGESHEEDQIREAFRYEAFDFVPKPLDPALLRASLPMLATIERQRIELEERATASEADRSRLRELVDTLEARNAELDQYAALASHDLKEPLHTIISFCDVLESDHAEALGAKGVEYLGFVSSRARRMRQLVDDMLWFARVGADAALPAPCPLGETMQQAVASLRATIEELGATVEVEPMPTVLGDRTRLGLVFQNLLDNALKYARPGVTPAVTVRASRARSEWIVQVVDNGMGIAPTQHERVFGLFRRGERGGGTEGSGVGLAVVRKVVGQLRGRIWLQSEVGVGTTFFVALPAADPPPG